MTAQATRGGWASRFSGIRMARPALSRGHALREAEDTGEIARAVDAPADDVVYPGAYDTGHMDRRAWWAARAMGLVAGIEAFVIGLQALALYGLTPLKSVEIVLVNLNPASNQVVEMLPLKVGTQGLSIATRYWLAEWLKRRHDITPDAPFMRAQALWLQKRTQSDVFAKYVETNGELVKDAIKKQITRTTAVEIGSINEQAPGLWVADITTADQSSKGDPLQQENWRVTMRVEFHKTEISKAELDKGADSNPFGLTIVDYVRVKR